ncbi:hypothetical protein TIFTF001_047626 [Ficus carica]|uniref:Uncharacterized protein n=1 Tax=Ficus carica TaxID=3494 RepID=A0AA87YW01_FICCA|nr:hypothetical protein TIFTF001_047626 [Ficus carica]
MLIKDIDPSSLGKERKCPHPGVVENTRYGGVSTQSILVAFYATKSRAAFNKAMTVFSDLVMDLKEMAREQGDDPLSKNETAKEMPFAIKDPIKPVQMKEIVKELDMIQGTAQKRKMEECKRRPKL